MTRWLSVVLAFGCTREEPPRRSPHDVRALHVDQLPDVADPLHAGWEAAPEHEARLLPQDIAEPKLLEVGVNRARVRALHDGGSIAFRLSWEDTTRDVLVGPSRFSDAAAVQLPTVPGDDVPDVAMGLRGRPVYILYWKAAWQETRDPVAAAYPNAAIDHYPFQAATGENRKALEVVYAPARGVANPVAGRNGSPVQELIAEGFGTVVTAPKQQGTGRGVWRNGRWYVAFSRPLTLDRRTYVAVAIWDGSLGHVGAKKMRSAWIPLVSEDAR